MARREDRPVADCVNKISLLVVRDWLCILPIAPRYSALQGCSACALVRRYVLAVVQSSTSEIFENNMRMLLNGCYNTVDVQLSNIGPIRAVLHSASVDFGIDLL